MNSRSSLLSPPVILLFVLMFVSAIGGAVLRALGVDPYHQDLLHNVGFIWAIAWWLRIDSRAYGVTNPYCPGLLVAVAWPIILIHHLYQTRGARGFLIVLGFIAGVLVIHLLALVTYFLAGGTLPG